MDDYSVEGSARCPHCRFSVQFAKGFTENLRVGTYWTDYSLRWVECPHCREVVITLIQGKGEYSKEAVIYPLDSLRAPVPADVPAAIKAGYDQAAKTLSLSPNASAALSRRCMQAVLTDAGNAKKGRLYDQIGEVMPGLPTWLGQMLDEARNIGNFAAHANQDMDSGIIVDVEPGEAEWNLDVLDKLFEFYYVLPAATSRTREQLDKKLIATGQHTIEEQCEGRTSGTKGVPPKT